MGEIIKYHEYHESIPTAAIKLSPVFTEAAIQWCKDEGEDPTKIIKENFNCRHFRSMALYRERWIFQADQIQQHARLHNCIALGLKDGAVQFCKDHQHDPFETMPAFPWGYLEESEEYLEAERKSENPDFVKIAEIVKEIEEILDDKKNPKILWEFIAEDLQRHTWGHEYLKLGLKKGAIQWCRDIGKDPFRLLSPGQDGKAPTTWEVEFRFLQEHVKCHKYLALVDLEQMEPTLCTKYISRFRVHKVQMPTVAPDCQKCKSSHTDTIYR